MFHPWWQCLFAGELMLNVYHNRLSAVQMTKCDQCIVQPNTSLHDCKIVLQHFYDPCISLGSANQCNLARVSEIQCIKKRRKCVQSCLLEHGKLHEVV